jgi:DNA-binding LacI/PurR family transcriptional regulator
MGREAAKMLAYLLSNRDVSVPSKRILKTYLVHRESCAAMNKMMAV